MDDWVEGSAKARVLRLTGDSQRLSQMYSGGPVPLLLRVVAKAGKCHPGHRRGPNLVTILLSTGGLEGGRECPLTLAFWRTVPLPVTMTERGLFLSAVAELTGVQSGAGAAALGCGDRRE